jgi:hypothetical protein
MMQFAVWIENLEFFAYIRGSGYEFPILLSLHLVGLAFFAGLILLTDMRLLGWGLKGHSIATVVNATRWPKRVGFVWVAGCGFILGMSKAEGYFLNTFFQIKMVLFVCVALHALVFRPSVYNHPEELDKSPQIPGRAKLAGGLSLFLWLSILTMGRSIGYMGSPSGLHYSQLLKTILTLGRG